MDSMTQIFYEEICELLKNFKGCNDSYVKGQTYSPENLQEIFRNIHTIKADTTMMLYEDMASLTRAFENMLYCFRIYVRSQSDTERFHDCGCEYYDYMIHIVERMPEEGYVPEDATDLEEKLAVFADELSKKRENSEKLMEIPETPKKNKRKRQVYYIAPGTDATEEVEDEKQYDSSITDFEMVARKLERVVDEMSVKLNKPAKLLVRGEKTKIEKSKREKISSALLHVIRNAVDHGIEDSEVREKLGKSPMGMVWLNFTKDTSGVLTISVKDDGSGIDYQEVLMSAEKMHLLTKPREKYNVEEITELMLGSGVTTMKSQNDYSGRGVGMDVVNCNVKELGGKLEIKSIHGEGTEIFITI